MLLFAAAAKLASELAPSVLSLWETVSPLSVMNALNVVLASANAPAMLSLSNLSGEKKKDVPLQGRLFF